MNGILVIHECMLTYPLTTCMDNELLNDCYICKITGVIMPSDQHETVPPSTLHVQSKGFINIVFLLFRPKLFLSSIFTQNLLFHKSTSCFQLFWTLAVSRMNSELPFFRNHKVIQLPNCEKRNHLTYKVSAN